ncbi:MAG: GTP cyclohydrolase FolE2 [Lysobacteraceae bacterium]
MPNQQNIDPAAALGIDETASALPDVAANRAAYSANGLDWVGMDAIELPIRIVDGDVDVRLPAKVSAEVDLLAGATRGIHMSRIYLALDAAVVAPLSPTMLQSLLHEFLASHAGLSTRARVRFAFDHFLRRPALASEHSGWRRYPISVTATMERDALAIDIGFDVVYSSTCPASTALARQLVAEDFGRAFPETAGLDRDAALRWLAGEQGMRATPHSQRSTATIKLRLDPAMVALPFTNWIDRAEDALGTAVQTAVKRIDEQAFARRNGENPMFCEDAARRLHQAFVGNNAASELGVCAVAVRVAHHESLHGHDAVASILSR